MRRLLVSAGLALARRLLGRGRADHARGLPPDGHLGHLHQGAAQRPGDHQRHPGQAGAGRIRSLIARVGLATSKDIVARVTFDEQPSVTNQQKRKFRDQIDAFVKGVQPRPTPTSPVACCRRSST